MSNHTSYAPVGDEEDSEQGESLLEHKTGSGSKTSRSRALWSHVLTAMIASMATVIISIAYTWSVSPKTCVLGNEIGVVAISRGESDRLVNGTAAAPRSPNKYMVELEMFHQLHCLKWVRDQLWELEGEASGAQRLDKNPPAYGSQRNFERIFDWAKGRAVTGMAADGAHQNVELETPEMFD
ncbi:hypothetical protein PG995_004609 [Apiospora arundinis]